jgi:hypothetical protein
MENTNLPCVWPIFAIDYRDPLSGVDSHATDYEGNRQLAARVGSSPRSIPATLFEGSHYIPSVGLAHDCIIAAILFEGSHYVPKMDGDWIRLWSSARMPTCNYAILKYYCPVNIRQENKNLG